MARWSRTSSATAANASAAARSRSIMACVESERARPSRSPANARVTTRSPSTTPTTLATVPAESASDKTMSPAPSSSSSARCVLTVSMLTLYPPERGLDDVGLFGVEAAGLDRATGQAGARQRTRGRAALGGGLLDGEGRRARRLVGTEDLLLGLAGQQRLELLLLDRLALDEDLGDDLERVLALGEDVLGALMRGLDDPADLVVDLAGDLVGVVRLGGELAAQERLAVVVAEHARAEALAHAEAHDHLLGRRGDLLEVVRGAGRDLVEDDLLRGAAAEGHGHRVVELGARGEELVLLRHRDGVAQGLPAADDRDLVDRVGVLEVVAADRVAHLVVGRDQPLLLAHDPGLLLRAGDHAHDPLFELDLGDLALAVAGGQQRGLVDEVRQVGAGEARRLPGERVDVDLLGQRLAARVDLEDLRAALAVRAVDDDLAVEAARAQQRRVEDVRTVGGGDQDDVVLHLEAVHLDEQLVERLLALVVTAAEAGAAVAPDGVDLVHEDDAGRVLLGLLEEVAHARGADADEHLDEVRAGDREERHARLAGDRAGQQRLAGARRPVQQHALGDARAERLELLGVLQELLDLVELLDRLVDARHVAERDLRRVDAHALGARLAERHHLRAAALDLVHEEDPEPDEDQERQDVGQQREPAVGLAALDVEVVDLVRALRGHQLIGDLLARGVREADLVLGLLRGLELDLDRVVLRLDDGLGDLAVLKLVDEVRVRVLSRLRARADQLLGEEREHDHDQDGKCCALEEPAHTQVFPRSDGMDKPTIAPSTDPAVFLRP